MAVTESTARVEVFQNIYSIINTNKLTGTTVLATFPEKSPTFPCYVIESAQVSNTSLAIDTGSRELNFLFNIYLYGDSRDGMEKIDQMKDNVIDSLRDSTNVTTLKSANISIINIDDEGVSQDQFRDMKINSGQLVISGVLLV
tara:strand:- start:114 stop:542 length:429 start_codon:yes stop_codon:yes gene_type:complete